MLTTLSGARTRRPHIIGKNTSTKNDTKDSHEHQKFDRTIQTNGKKSISSNVQNEKKDSSKNGHVSFPVTGVGKTGSGGKSNRRSPSRTIPYILINVNVYHMLNSYEKSKQPIHTYEKCWIQACLSIVLQYWPSKFPHRLNFVTVNEWLEISKQCGNTGLWRSLQSLDSIPQRMCLRPVVSLLQMTPSTEDDPSNMIWPIHACTPTHTSDLASSIPSHWCGQDWLWG